MRFSLLAGWPLTEPAEAIKRIRAVGPMALSPFLRLTGPFVISIRFGRMLASVLIALVEKSKYVRLKTVDFACIKL